MCSVQCAVRSVQCAVCSVQWVTVYLYCDVMSTMTLGKTERVVQKTMKALRAYLEDD